MRPDLRTTLHFAQAHVTRIQKSRVAPHGRTAGAVVRRGMRYPAERNQRWAIAAPSARGAAARGHAQPSDAMPALTDRLSVVRLRCGRCTATSRRGHAVATKQCTMRHATHDCVPAFAHRRLLATFTRHTTAHRSPPPSPPRLRHSSAATTSSFSLRPRGGRCRCRAPA